MPRILTATLARSLGLSLLVLLSACAQQSQPGYYDTPHDSTISDALQRAQGDVGVAAPSQVQLGFGNETRKQAPAQAAAGAAPGAAAAAGGSTQGAAAASSTPRGDVPQALTETRTYLGTVPCPDGSACGAARMTLTLAPDGQWRARTTLLNSSTTQAALGCWFLAGTQPTRIVLQSGDQPYATLELIQSNVLRLTRLNGQTPLLESRLTRQADIDPIDDLASRPAQACPAQ